MVSIIVIIATSRALRTAIPLFQYIPDLLFVLYLLCCFISVTISLHCNCTLVDSENTAQNNLFSRGSFLL